MSERNMPKNRKYTEIPTKPTVAQAELLALLRYMYLGRPDAHKMLVQAIDNYVRTEYGRGYHDGARDTARMPL